MNAEPPCAAQEGELLQDLADGSLDAETARKVTEHLQACGACATELNDLRSFEESMRASHLSTSELVEAAWSGSSANDLHFQACPACRDEVAMVRAARPVEEASEIAALPPRPARNPGRGFVPLALAAVLIAGLGLALLTAVAWTRRAFTPEEGSTTRGVASQIDGVAPAGDVSRGLAELAFTWDGTPESRYAVSFFSRDGLLLARVEVSGTRLVVEAAERAKLDHEPMFFWRVESLTGRTRGSRSVLTLVSWLP